MKTFTAIQVISALIGIYILVTMTGCSVKMESEWFGKTEKDDRSISQGLYPEGVTQQRELKQRY